MSDQGSGGSSVTFTVKELIQNLGDEVTSQLEAITKQLQELAAILNSKASDARVDGLEARLKSAEDQIIQLNLARAGSTALTGVMKVVFGGVGATVVGSLIGLLILAAHGGHL